ncbi:MAG TPA: MacB family efflux pump subunit, partial [Burkholderiales bacterium]|nr:MacB family efflux pump subunit [Burkholderiales bacterium]
MSSASKPLVLPVDEAIPLIELVDVTKTYRNGDLAVQVLHDISLRIYPGEFVAIMGASGSGKSTLMNILGCLDRPSSGRYLFVGEDVAQFEGDELARLRREAFGFVFQSYNLLPGATALENVEVPAVYAGLSRHARHQRAGELLTSLGLQDRLEHRPTQLSGGQQQRVSIARALMNGGQIILADEPTGALDSRSGEEVMALLKDLSAQGHTIILITHAKEVAEQAQRLIEIKDGSIVADQGPSPRVGAPALHVSARDTAMTRSMLADAVEAVKTAARALRANLFRTVLTLLGIVIGVGSVIVMLAVGDGAKEAVLDRISAMGTNLLLVRAQADRQRGLGRTSIATLMPGDAEAIAELPHVVAAVPELTGGVTLRYGNADYQADATSTSADFPVARAWEPVQGTFFEDDDVRRYAAVAVLGQTVVDNLFLQGEDPIGKYVVINNVTFQVIGVMGLRGASPEGTDLDDVVLVPLTTGGLRLFGRRYLRNVTVAVDDVSNLESTQAEIEQLMLARHGKEDFQVRNMSSLIDAAAETQNTLTVLLGSVAAISLLVGGIGVMNIMLVSVTERTREIGIRMATGARMRNILQQFLTEAVAVSGIGGFIGVCIGLVVAAMLQHFGTPIVFSSEPVILAFGCAF